MTSGVGPVSYIRVYTDASNVTRFEDLGYAVTAVEFAPPAPPVHVTEPMDATKVLFLSFPSGWASRGHPSPARQFCFYLSGEAIVTAAWKSVGWVRALCSCWKTLSDPATAWSSWPIWCAP